MLRLRERRRPKRDGKPTAPLSGDPLEPAVRAIRSFDCHTPNAATPAVACFGNLDSLSCNPPDLGDMPFHGFASFNLAPIIETASAHVIRAAMTTAFIRLQHSSSLAKICHED